MREQLLGYLMDALEPDERRLVEERLRDDARLQRELELLHEALEPLRQTEDEFEPPAGLAARTSQLAAEGRREPAPQPAAGEPLGGPSRWSLMDLAVAAGIFIAAGLLFFPAIQHSRASARLTACQNNLRRLGAALTEYSGLNHNYFPAVPREGNLAAAGVYSVRLAEQGLLKDPSWLTCPASEQAEPVRILSAAEIEAARGAALRQMWRQMGGSYGYTFGYVNERGYQNVRNLRRAHFALMADSPSPGGGDFASRNHGRAGQNVLYEDGHVRHLVDCVEQGRGDHIFLNDRGRVAAGTHPNDAVVGPSAAAPLGRKVSR